MGRQFGLSARPLLGIDKVYLQRGAETRKKAPLRHMGVDEIHLGKKEKFLTVVSNLETRRASLVLARNAKKRRWTNTSGGNSTNGRGGRLKLLCVDMWEPFTKSILKWSPGCRIRLRQIPRDAARQRCDR